MRYPSTGIVAEGRRSQPQIFKKGKRRGEVEEFWARRRICQGEYSEGGRKSVQLDEGDFVVVPSVAV